MKHLYNIVAILVSSTLFAQFHLEHTYENEDGIVRVNLENSGEKYYGVNNNTHLIMLYNADHTFWKSIPIVPTNAAFTYIRHLSESKINPDANIEVAYYSGYYVGSTTNYVSKVVSEDGTTILTEDGANSINLSQIEGLPDKIITSKQDGTSKVYNTSGMLEHFYSEGTAGRVKLENSGEKYYVLDSANGQAKIMNADHTTWKTIALTKPAGAEYRYLTMVSETQINSDPLLEISYTYYQASGSSNWESKLINENGALLLTVPYCSWISYSHLDGCADKLMTRDIHFGVISTTVYNLPTLNLEHVFPQLTYREIMQDAGEKYFNINVDNGNAVVYNSDYSIFKSISLPVPANATYSVIDQVSQKKANADELIEVSYGYTIPTDGHFYYERKLINENGEVLLTVPDCINLSIIGSADLPYKPIGLMLTETPGGGVFATVYGFGLLSLSTSNEEQRMIYPNPVDSILYIKNGIDIISAEIYGVTGNLVQSIANGPITEIATGNLPSGVYFLTLTDKNSARFKSKILVFR